MKEFVYAIVTSLVLDDFMSELVLKSLKNQSAAFDLDEES